MMLWSDNEGDLPASLGVRLSIALIQPSFAVMERAFSQLCGDDIERTMQLPSRLHSTENLETNPLRVFPRGTLGKIMC